MGAVNSDIFLVGKVILQALRSLLSSTSCTCISLVWPASPAWGTNTITMLSLANHVIENMLAFISRTSSVSPLKPHFHLELFINLERLTWFKRWSCRWMPMGREQAMRCSLQEMAPKKAEHFCVGCIDGLASLHTHTGSLTFEIQGFSTLDTGASQPMPSLSSQGTFSKVGGHFCCDNLEGLATGI